MPERDQNLPLHDEAKARNKWRGGETILEEGENLRLPASEVDDAKLGGANQGDGRSGKAGPGSFPSPD